MKEYVIYRASLAGGEREMFLNSSHGIGIVDGKFAFVNHLTHLNVIIIHPNCAKREGPGFVLEY